MLGVILRRLQPILHPRVGVTARMAERGRVVADPICLGDHPTDRPSSARSHGADPQDHQGQTRWRLRVAHQESSRIQTLGQAAAETQEVSSATQAGFFLKVPESLGKRA
jgi:hypothetical protein